MPRDVLLVLVLVAVLLNLALLVGVGVGRWRATRATARPGRNPRRGATTRPAPPHEAVVQPPRPAPWSQAGTRVIPALAGRERSRPIDPQLLPLEPPVAQTPTNGPLPAVTVPVAAGRSSDRIRSTASPATPAEREPLTGDQDQAGTKQETGNRRGRRFVLPPDDEDLGRTERAIEAFLGEPAPSGSSSAHRPRRRARRQRAPGEAPAAIVLVAALAGYDELRNTLGREGAVRFAEAYGEALRATLRSGDHVTDLGQGRLRLVVHADEDGARALMERARAVCQPWLRLAPVPLALRVRPMPEARPADARREDGRTNGSAPPIEARSSRQPDDVARRRLAAG